LHVIQSAKAERVEKAVVTVLKEGKHLTPDLGGTLTTREVTEAIIDALEA